MAFDLETWRVIDSQPEGTGKLELDAPEGMAVADGRIFVVDTANHRMVRWPRPFTCQPRARLLASLTRSHRAVACGSGASAMARAPLAQLAPACVLASLRPAR